MTTTTTLAERAAATAAVEAGPIGTGNKSRPVARSVKALFKWDQILHRLDLAVRPQNTFKYLATLAASVGLCTAIAVGPADLAAADPVDGAADSTATADRGPAAPGRSTRTGTKTGP